MLKREKFLSIPNLVTSSRIVILIILWVLFFLKETTVMGVLLIVAGFTDFLDGFLARRLKQETAFGAQFDSFADHLVAGSALIWLLVLFPRLFLENKITMGIALIFIAIAWSICILKFKRTPDLHLISDKIMTVLLYLFVVHAFFFGYNIPFLYIIVAGTILMEIEEIIIFLKYDIVDEHIKSIFQK